MADRTIEMGDGRVLGYREYGDPDGKPVVSCHGGLLSGLDIAPFDGAARAAGVRIVSPDRPGIGASTPSPGRTTAEWADDVRRLLDGLGIDHAAVIGWSMGGQYALACAALLAGRVDRAVVVAGALPLDDESIFHELPAMDQRLTRLSRRHPHTARATFATMGRVARHMPKAWTRSAVRGEPAADAAAVRALSDPGLARAAAAALSCSGAMVEEYAAWARPWGFAAADVAVPTTIWQGEADPLVPMRWGEELARQVPGSRLVLRPDAGHFVAFRNQEAVLRDLV